MPPADDAAVGAQLAAVVVGKVERARRFALDALCRRRHGIADDGCAVFIADERARLPTGPDTGRARFAEARETFVDFAIAVAVDAVASLFAPWARHRVAYGSGSVGAAYRDPRPRTDAEARFARGAGIEPFVDGAVVVVVVGAVALLRRWRERIDDANLAVGEAPVTGGVDGGVRQRVSTWTDDGAIEVEDEVVPIDVDALALESARAVIDPLVGGALDSNFDDPAEEVSITAGVVPDESARRLDAVAVGHVTGGQCVLDDGNRDRDLRRIGVGRTTVFGAGELVGQTVAIVIDAVRADFVSRRSGVASIGDRPCNTGGRTGRCAGPDAALGRLDCEVFVDGAVSIVVEPIAPIDAVGAWIDDVEHAVGVGPIVGPVDDRVRDRVSTLTDAGAVEVEDRVVPIDVGPVADECAGLATDDFGVGAVDPHVHDAREQRTGRANIRPRHPAGIGDPGPVRSSAAHEIEREHGMGDRDLGRRAIRRASADVARAFVVMLHRSTTRSRPVDRPGLASKYTSGRPTSTTSASTSGAQGSWACAPPAQPIAIAGTTHR